MDHADIRARFSSLFGRDCAVVARAPGRVNLIGDHTDYNDGFVLPIAIQRETIAAAAPRSDDLVRVHSAQLGETQSWLLGEWRRGEHPHWTSYVAGVIERLRARRAGAPGVDLLIESDIPIGGGLSSSAALELATALAVERLEHSASICSGRAPYRPKTSTSGAGSGCYNKGRNPLAGARLGSGDLIELCRQAEHEFAGVPCGVMDQTVSLLARADHALLLDCRSGSVKHIPCRLDEHAFFVADSGVRHELASGQYALRREQCARAVDLFQAADPRVTSLRDVTPELLARWVADEDGVVAARARHVVSENRRVIAAADALDKRDLETVGRLMTESHRSLRDDYEVSCRELDQLVETIAGVDGVLGARMTGGGFGGCAVFLARLDSADCVRQAISDRHDAPNRAFAEPLLCHPSGGATVVACSSR